MHIQIVNTIILCKIANNSVTNVYTTHSHINNAYVTYNLTTFACITTVSHNIREPLQRGLCAAPMCV